MANQFDIMEQIRELPLEQQRNIPYYLEGIILLRTEVAEIGKEVKENRFANGKICPLCKAETVSRYGKYKNKQRYICKSCRKTFTDYYLSATYNSKKPLDKWLTYIKCMIAGYSIRKAAEIVQINIATSFFWRHKILDCIKTFLGKGSVEGVIEADECFFAESYKGVKATNMPRRSRKRGKGRTKRGISVEQICIATAMDRQGNLIIELLCKGKMIASQLSKLYDGHIEEGLSCAPTATKVTLDSLRTFH